MQAEQEQLSADTRALRSQLAALTGELRELRIALEAQPLPVGLGLGSAAAAVTEEAAQAAAAVAAAVAAPAPAKQQPPPEIKVAAAASRPPVLTADPVAPGVAGTTLALVKSAGFQAGNFAEFYLDGKKIMISGPASNRGVNVVIIDPQNKRVVSGKCYDTWANPTDGNRLLASELNQLPDGHVVMVALKDSGLENLDPGTLAALRGLGATMLTEKLRERDSYALVGVKGGAALAEGRAQRLSDSAEIEGTLPCAVSAPNFPFSMASLPGGHEPKKLPGGQDVKAVLEQGEKMGFSTDGTKAGSQPKGGAAGFQQQPTPPSFSPDGKQQPTPVQQQQRTPGGFQPGLAGSLRPQGTPAGGVRPSAAPPGGGGGGVAGSVIPQGVPAAAKPQPGGFKPR